MPVIGAVIVEKDAKAPRIARIRLNRPECLNAISSTMPADIRRAVEWVEADDVVGVARHLEEEHVPGAPELVVARHPRGHQGRAGGRHRGGGGAGGSHCSNTLWA